MRGSIEPCLCGVPDCDLCFPGNQESELRRIRREWNTTNIGSPSSPIRQAQDDIRFLLDIICGDTYA